MMHSAPSEDSVRLVEHNCAKCGVALEPIKLTGFLDEFVLRYVGTILCDPCGVPAAEAWEKKKAYDAFLEKRQSLHREGWLDKRIFAESFNLSNRDLEKASESSWKLLRSTSRDKLALLGQNYYFWGKPGTGKTFAARCLMNRAMWHGARAAEVKARRFLKDARTFSEGGRGRFKFYGQVPLLLFDDIDKATWKEEDAAAFAELMDDRCSFGGRTIITSNLEPMAVRKYLTDRVPMNTSLITASFDRLKPVKVLEFTGKSMR